MRGFVLTILSAVLGVVASALIVVADVRPARACSMTDPTCGSGGGAGAGGSGVSSSPTKRAQYVAPQRTCSVYANGAGMGSYCVSLTGGSQALGTLRERFNGQELERCRYSEVPATLEKPYNARPDRGRYMMMSCLNNIDFDTYSGGRDRTLDVSVVFVEHGADIRYRDNPLSQFLWRQVERAAQLPVPFLVTRPNVIPVVGSPTFFTFRWVDPVSKKVVAEGRYADRERGGPFKQITQNGFTMQAQATAIRINPNQKGIKPTRCAADTPYREGAAANAQPAGACVITFPRSSASARELATKPIPDNIDDAFYADIEVRWRVRYGEQGQVNRELGDGFTMRIKQVVPVQEVQAANQPPFILF